MCVCHPLLYYLTSSKKGADAEKIKCIHFVLFSFVSHLNHFYLLCFWSVRPYKINSYMKESSLSHYQVCCCQLCNQEACNSMVFSTSCREAITERWILLFRPCISVLQIVHVYPSLPYVNYIETYSHVNICEMHWDMFLCESVQELKAQHTVCIGTI